MSASSGTRFTRRSHSLIVGSSSRSSISATLTVFFNSIVWCSYAMPSRQCRTWRFQKAGQNRAVRSPKRVRARHQVFSAEEKMTDSQGSASHGLYVCGSEFMYLGNSGEWRRLRIVTALKQEWLVSRPLVNELYSPLSISAKTRWSATNAPTVLKQFFSEQFVVSAQTPTQAK